jgi:hypothetical protein
MGLHNLSLLRLTELVLVSRQAREQPSNLWQDVLRIATGTGDASCVYPALRMADRFVPGTVPEAVLAALAGKAPAAVTRVLAGLGPATCQRLLRCSFKERFMWTATIGGWAREMADACLPRAPLGELRRIYATRFWRVARGSISR